MEKIDVSIQRGHVPEHGLQVGRVIDPFLQANSKQLWLLVPGVARFLISHGDTIIYDPLPESDDNSIRVFMLGSCTGALLFQRGYLVLHGNAFRVGDGCILCVGHSGIGKSTLAAAMMLRGHAILSDDVCPIDAEGRAIPGMARIKLWQDSADALGIDTTELSRIRPNMDKYNYPLNGAFHTAPLSVKAVYVLRPSNETNVSVRRVHGMNKYVPLKNHTYRFSYVKAMGLSEQHFQQCSQIAQGIHLSRIYRPRGDDFLLDELADFILQDTSKLGI